MRNIKKKLIQKNLIYNISQFEKYQPKTKICAVVKSNAYGCGVVEVVQTIDNLVDYFAVINDEEAIYLRTLTKKNILILSPVLHNQMLDKLIQNDINFSVASISQIKSIESVAKRLCKNANVHIKINTGMNRYGVSNKQDFLNMYNYIKHSQHLNLQGIFSHFYDSTSEIECDKQLNRFNDYLAGIDSSNILLHIASSNSSILNERYCLDMVRLGILLYGSSVVAPPFRIKPVLQIESYIECINYVSKGEHIGYNDTVAEKDMKIAVVPIGYADGYSRNLSNCSQMICCGKVCKVVGTICMNCTLLDVSEINAKVGKKVIVLGRSNGKEITPNMLANCTEQLYTNETNQSKTLACEVLTNFSKQE